MRRKSERNKSKSTPEKSPEKPSRRSHRHSRRRRKSSSSSSDDEPGVRSRSRVKTDSTSDKTGSRSVTPDSKPNVAEIPEPQARPESVPDADVVKNDTDSKCESVMPDDAKPKDALPGSGEWKEDNNFWQTDEKKDDHSGAANASAASEEKTKDSKDAAEVWKVQSANGSTGKGGEIQKLKICRQRLAESPELPKETPPRRRLSRTPKDSSGSNKNIDDNDDKPAAEEANKNVEQETSSSSTPSPPVHEALNVICETESPTKIKIINVGSLTPDKKSHTPPISLAETPVSSIEVPKPADTNKPIQTNEKEEETVDSTEEEKNVKESKTPKESESPEKSTAGEETTVTEETKIIQEDVQESEQKTENDDTGNKSEQETVEKSPSPVPESTEQETILSSIELPKNEESNENVETEKQEEENKQRLVSSEKQKPVRRSSNSKSPSNEKEERRSVKKSSSPSPRRERKRRDSSSSSSSSDDSSSSSDSDSSSHNRKKSSKSKRRSGTKSAVSSKSTKKATSDSEDDRHHKKKEVPQQEIQLDRTHSANSNKENLVTNSQPASAGDSGGAGTADQGGAVVTRKRRWGASKTIRPVKKPVLSISTDSLKNLIPGAKPIPAEELQLSVEEEEGQLDDDEDEIVEVAQQAEKESTKKKEREREKEERRKEHKEKDEERKKKYSERKNAKPEKPSASGSDNQKGSSSRKILLITDDARKLAHSPSPPRRRPSNVLFITNLVRPFTAQQLKNLLLRTGTIAENGFWIDKIKSKCYVEYTTEDAAVETRHALHGVRWPVNNPKTLVVEFASHDDMAVAQALSEETDPIPRKAEPLVIDRSVEGWIADQARLKAQGDRSNRRVMAAIREWDVGKPEHPDEIIEQDHRARERQREQERRMRKERSHRSMTPDISELPARKQRRKEDDAPVKLLDDLFKKTKTSPCIYWLPLTAEQIAVKEEMRRKHMAEHERRVAEMKKAEQARRERDRRNRK